MATDKSGNAESQIQAQTGESSGQIADLLKKLGLTPKSTMQQFAAAIQQSGGLTPSELGLGGGPGVLGDLTGAAKGVASGVEGIGSGIDKAIGPSNPVNWTLENIGAGGIPELVNLIGQGLTGSTQSSEPTPAPKKEKAKPLPSPSDAAKNIPESPFEQLAQSLASEYLGQVQQLMPLTSGSGIFGPNGQTNATVNQAAAAIPGGGAWLQQQAAAEQQAAQPLQAAMSQVGEAQAQGAIPFASAIANTGTANTQYLEAAPWQQILAELASETAYKAASTSGASAFGATPQNTPAFLQQIFKNLGLAGTAGTTGGGLTAPGTAAKGGSGSASSALSSGSSQTG